MKLPEFDMEVETPQDNESRHSINNLPLSRISVSYQIFNSSWTDALTHRCCRSMRSVGRCTGPSH